MDAPIVRKGADPNIVASEAKADEEEFDFGMMDEGDGLGFGSGEDGFGDGFGDGFSEAAADGGSKDENEESFGF